MTIDRRVYMALLSVMGLLVPSITSTSLLTARLVMMMRLIARGMRGMIYLWLLSGVVVLRDGGRHRRLHVRRVRKGRGEGRASVRLSLILVLAHLSLARELRWEAATAGAGAATEVTGGWEAHVLLVRGVVVASAASSLGRVAASSWAGRRSALRRTHRHTRLSSHVRCLDVT